MDGGPGAVSSWATSDPVSGTQAVWGHGPLSSRGTIRPWVMGSCPSLGPVAPPSTAAPNQGSILSFPVHGRPPIVQQSSVSTTELQGRLAAQVGPLETLEVRPQKQELPQSRLSGPSRCSVSGVETAAPVPGSGS